MGIQGKQLNLKYGAHCSVCGEFAASGTLAYWAKGQGIWCLEHGAASNSRKLAGKPAKTVPPINAHPANPAYELPAFGPVYALLEAAEKHIKRPKIMLILSDKYELVIYKAQGGAQPGTVNVKQRGPYGSAEWFGRVYEDGRFVRRMSLIGTPRMGEIQAVLEALADDPQTTLAAMGRAAGHCCYCFTLLTDEKSETLGYGPTCAKNYGLPYGVKAAKAAKEASNA